MTYTEFKRFADENNIVPVSTEIYSQMITDSVKHAKMKEVLQEIQREITDMIDQNTTFDSDNARAQIIALEWVLEIIDEHLEEIEG